VGISPGNGSPEAAVDGLFSSTLAGNQTTGCQYLEPSSQQICEDAAASEPPSSGTFSISGQVIEGTEALVSVTGSLCQSGYPCGTNSDPSFGMPPGAGSFADAYDAASAAVDSSETFVLSPVPCIEISGKWYINESFGNAGTGNT